MQRDEIVLKLLAMGPAPRSDLVRCTGWGIAETNEVVDRLMQSGEVVAFPSWGNTRKTARLLCLPPMREEAMRVRGTAGKKAILRAAGVPNAHA